MTALCPLRSFRVAHFLPALATAFLLATPARAVVRDSASFTNLLPVQTATPGSGTLFTANFLTTGYTLQRVRFSGTLEEINGVTNDFASENRIQVTRPDGFSSVIQLSNFNNYSGAFAFDASLSYAPPVAITAGGTWQFRYFNSSDDGTQGVADARLNTLSVELRDDAVPPPPPPTTAVNFGTLGNPSADYTVPDYSADVSVSAGQIQWLAFDLLEPLDLSTKFLDIDTQGSVITDTQIGLYNALGVLIATDDEDGSGSLSALSLGATTPRPAIGTGVAGNGRDGLIGAGRYYLAVGGFVSSFGNDFAASSTSTATGAIRVNLRTNVVGVVVPEASSLLLLAPAFGLLACGVQQRRRR